MWRAPENVVLAIGSYTPPGGVFKALSLTRTTRNIEGGRKRIPTVAWMYQVEQVGPLVAPSTATALFKS